MSSDGAPHFCEWQAYYPLLGLTAQAVFPRQIILLKECHNLSNPISTRPHVTDTLKPLSRKITIPSVLVRTQ